MELCDCANTDTSSCEMTKSRLKDGYHKTNIINDSYINGKTVLLDNCEINGDSIFREGKYYDCDISSSVEIVEAEEIKKPKKI